MIVGQAPSRLSDPAEPLSGRSGERLSDLCGLQMPEFLARFERRNLISMWPGKAGKGDAIGSAADRRDMAEILLSEAAGRRMVLLGAAVGKAFDFKPDALLTFVKHRGAVIAVCPHPSGISRWWNASANVALARAFWLRLASESDL